MAAVAALLDSRSALLSLRRTLAPAPPAVLACASAAGLRRALESRLLDAVVVGQKALRLPELLQLRVQFPALPVVVYAMFRPDDGELLARLEGPGGVAAVAVEGVEDAVAGDLVRRVTLAAERRRVLAGGPRLLRLTEPIQQRAWALLLESSGAPLRTTDVAARLGISREHLSRQFAAGGAPNLKRVLDLLRVLAAAQLLANPGYGVAQVGRILGFASTGHLGTTVQRIAGVGPAALRTVPPVRVFEAFVRGATRSRM